MPELSDQFPANPTGLKSPDQSYPCMNSNDRAAPDHLDAMAEPQRADKRPGMVLPCISKR